MIKETQLKNWMQLRALGLQSEPRHWIAASGCLVADIIAPTLELAPNKNLENSIDCFRWATWWRNLGLIFLVRQSRLAKRESALPPTNIEESYCLCTLLFSYKMHVHRQSLLRIFESIRWLSEKHCLQNGAVRMFADESQCWNEKCGICIWISSLARHLHVYFSVFLILAYWFRLKYDSADQWTCQRPVYWH